MSLRPAKALVAESSNFSLRTFFEARAASAVPVEAMPATPVSPTTPTTAAALPPLSALPKIASRENNKFTFNGLVMPSSVQSHHHHHHQGHATGATTATPVTAAGLHSMAATAATAASTAADASETLRLKAAVHTLNEKVAHLTSNLSTTSESVMRGNKALVAERAQFHAQYASMQDKLKDTQAALTEAEAAPNLAIKNEKLLTAKIIELQEENERLATSAAEEDAAALVRSEEFEERFTSLSAQHSLLLDKHSNLTREFEERGVLLTAALADIDAAHARAEALHVQAASADALVDTLDSKLAAARAPTDPTGGCGCGSGGVADEPASKSDESSSDDDEDGEKKEKQSKPVGAELEDMPFFEKMAAVSLGRGLMEEKQRLSQRYIDFETAAGAAERVAHDEECCCETTKSIAREEHKYLDAMARRVGTCIASGLPESVMAIHMFTDPNHEEQAEYATSTGTSLAAHILPGVGFAKGARREVGLLNCALPEDTGANFPNTTEGRTQSFIEAVSRDVKLSMDGSQAAYQNSMKTGAAVRV